MRPDKPHPLNLTHARTCALLALTRIDEIACSLDDILSQLGLDHMSAAYACRRMPDGDLEISPTETFGYPVTEVSTILDAVSPRWRGMRSAFRISCDDQGLLLTDHSTLYPTLLEVLGGISIAADIDSLCGDMTIHVTSSPRWVRHTSDGREEPVPPSCLTYKLRDLTAMLVLERCATPLRDAIRGALDMEATEPGLARVEGEQALHLVQTLPPRAIHCGECGVTHEDPRISRFVAADEGPVPDGFILSIPRRGGSVRLMCPAEHEIISGCQRIVD